MASLQLFSSLSKKQRPETCAEPAAATALLHPKLLMAITCYSPAPGLAQQVRRLKGFLPFRLWIWCVERRFPRTGECVAAPLSGACSGLQTIGLTCRRPAVIWCNYAKLCNNRPDCTLQAVQAPSAGLLGPQVRKFTRFPVNQALPRRLAESQPRRNKGLACLASSQWSAVSGQLFSSSLPQGNTS